MPRLPTHLVGIREAFDVLSSARSSGFVGGNPIAFADIVAYHRAAGVGDLQTFTRLIQELDSVFLSWQNERITTGAKK
jgi:hypothetical protein